METQIKIGSKRLDYIDIAKSLGMLTIIWGHILHSGWSNLMVYSFHIPLFFFLSGMVFNADKYQSVGQLIKRRAKTLLLPYFIFSFVTWLLWVEMRVAAHDATNYWYPLLQTFIAQGSSGFLRHNLPLWFVPCLFVVELMFYYINKLPKIGGFVFVVVCSFIGNYMIRGGHLEYFRLLPWSIEGAMSSVIFYATGNWLTQSYNHQILQSLALKRQLVSAVICLLLFVGLYFSSVNNGPVSIGSNELGYNTWIFYLNAYIGIAAMLLLCIMLSAYAPKTTGGNHIMGYVKWFGQNSFYVMATHFPIKEALSRIVDKLLNCNVRSDVTPALLVFVLTLVADTLVVWFICWLKKKFNSKKNAQRSNI